MYLSSKSRTSHEVRGLKLSILENMRDGGKSHLTRGAWIEMVLNTLPSAKFPSHLTRGAWIEMTITWADITGIGSRTSHEVRGLKLLPVTDCTPGEVSHLTRGAWIEI